MGIITIITLWYLRIFSPAAGHRGDQSSWSSLRYALPKTVAI